MRKVYLLLLLIGCSTAVLAQKNGTIKGVAFDTISKQPVAMATISVLEKKDSSLVTFSMTDAAGRFELKGLANGEYRLLITHVNYHSSNTVFTISDAEKIKDFGSVAMADKAKVLSEVVVGNDAPPVTLIGDTVQYNAGSFRVQPNANVEQLLKKLPGVKVDKDGTVTAQGEKVNRVLVDGKEFFGNDPKIATRNLPADAVDKVQVYDKQSDQAQLTGFDDGNYEKTINLKLKKDKKKGLFGKIMAGAGDKERYEGRFNVNSFKGARQMSVIGMGNNTNAEGFSFMDILNFTGALNQMKQGMSGGGVNISMSADDAASYGMAMGGRNSGINTTAGGGVNYNNLIGEKLDLQSNYFYNRFNPESITRTLRQTTSGSLTNIDKSVVNTDNMNNTHRVNLNLLYQIDSMNSIRITPSFSYQKTKNRSRRDFSAERSDGSMVNAGFSNNESNNEGYTFRNDIIYRKKFQRKGRTFSLSLNSNLNKSDGDGSLESIINSYTNGNISKRDTLDQRSTSKGDLKGYTARAVYTEPLWKRTLLEFSAGKSNTTSTSEKITYNFNKNSGKYDAINAAQTNDFENIYGYTTAGFRMRKQGKKYNYSLGVNWQKAELEGKIITG
ncbi:MAG TPA: carboxypeptidase regulatory-like domain-containing protein, partial [Chitinophagaceae bacterium]